jgi:hypothetical protein
MGWVSLLGGNSFVNVLRSSLFGVLFLAFTPRNEAKPRHILIGGLKVMGRGGVLWTAMMELPTQ